MNKKTILWLVIGALAVVAVFCIVVCVACAFNGLTFGEQIVQWFAPKAKLSIGIINLF